VICRRGKKSVGVGMRIDQQLKIESRELRVELSRATDRISKHPVSLLIVTIHIEYRGRLSTLYLVLCMTAK